MTSEVINSLASSVQRPGLTALLKTFLLLSCTFLGLICGTLYLYSSYSPQIAHVLHYSVSDSLKIGLSGLIGVGLSGPLVGKAVDTVGFSFPIIVGGIWTILLYFCLKLQLDFQHSNVSLSCYFLFMIGFGSTLMNSACLKCCAINFPTIRGVATALPLALYGLSALFFSVVASVFFPGNTSGFLGFMTIALLVVFLICSPKIILYEYELKLMRSKALQEIELDTFSGEISTQPDTETIGSNRILLQQIGGLKLFRTQKFWLMFLVTGILAATGQMYIYSVGYITKALIVHSATPDTVGDLDLEIQRLLQWQVGLLSIANFVGRISAGVLGDMISHHTSLHSKPRSLLLVVPAVGMYFSQFLGIRCQTYEELSLVSLSVGFFYGFTFCIMPLVVGDTFGLDNFSLNWGFVGLAPVLLSPYFTSLFGETFDRNSQVTEKGESICTLGSGCYSSVFVFTLYVTFFAAILSMAFNWRHH